MTEDADLAQLRTRVAALEAENADLRRRSEAAIERETRQAKKLDELGLDLNEVMTKPGAKEFRGLVRAARWVIRLFRWKIPQKLREIRPGMKLKNR